MTIPAETDADARDAARRQRVVLVAYFALGGISIIVQTLLIREFLVVFGGSELTVGVILGLWLLWIAIGARVGAFACSRIRRAAGGFFVAVLLGCVWVPVAILLIRDVRGLLHPPAGGLIAFWPMVGFVGATLAPFSFMVGFTFPLGLRVFASERDRDARKIGWIYVVEATGSLAGGVLFTFVLVTHVPGLVNAVCTGLVGVGAVGCALVLLAAPRRFAKIAVSAAVLATVTGLLVGRLLAREPERQSLARRFDSLQTHTEPVVSRDSRYQNIVLSRLGEQYNLYLNGANAAWFPDEPLHEATANVVLSQHPSPRRVLVIGGGAEGLLEEMLGSHLEKLDYVELDPAVLQVVEGCLPPQDAAALRAPGVTVHHTDGRLYVRTTDERYDLVFVNVPDPSTAMLNRYYTREFYQEVRRILAPGAVVAVRLSAAEAYFAGLKGAYAASILRTLNDVFPYVVLMPQEWSCFFASMQGAVVTTDAERLARRFRRRAVDTQHFRAEAFHSYFYPGAAERFARRLLGRTDVRANTDLRPISYFHNLLLWDEYSGSRLRPHLERMQRVGLGRIALVIAALCTVWGSWILLTPGRTAGHRRTNYLLCVSAAGFAAMGLEVLLIFGFQNLYGYIYQAIGLLVAVFMFGLAAGGAVMNRRLPRLGPGDGLLMAVQALIAVFALALPPLLGGLGGRLSGWLGPAATQLLFGLLVGLAGFLTGLELPLASALCLRRSDRMSKVAGLVDGADHAGACVGALVCGALLIPVLGVVQTCVLVAAINLAALALLVVTEVAARRTSASAATGV